MQSEPEWGPVTYFQGMTTNPCFKMCSSGPSYDLVGTLISTLPSIIIITCEKPKGLPFKQ